MFGVLVPVWLAWTVAGAAETTEAPAAPDPVAVPAEAPALAPALTPVGLGLDILPWVGASATAQGSDDRNLSLGLLGTYSGGIDGLEATTVLGIVRTRVDGAQLSGGINVVGQSVDGLQAAGGVNIVGGSVDGVQWAGGANIAAGSVDGFQAAGGVNLAASDVDGMQVAGGANVAGGTVDGPQIAAGLNVARGVRGVQIAVVNLSTDDVEGAQLGIVNIARDSDVSLGIINIIYEGRTNVDIWRGAGGWNEFALKHGSRKVHYIYGGGVNSTSRCPEWALTLGMGGHFELSHSLFLETDLLARHISPTTGFLLATNTLGTARAVAGLQVFEQVAFTAGLTANTLVSSVQDGASYAEKGSSVAHQGALTVRSFPGVQFGVQLF